MPDTGTGYFVLRMGFYAQQLKWWQEYFPMTQLKIIDGGKFKQNPVPILQDIEDFLEIPKYIQVRHFKISRNNGFLYKQQKWVYAFH